MAIKPFLLFKLSCTAALRGTFIVINTWVEILSASIYFHASIFSRFIFGIISLMTLPARAVVALQREKQLQAQLRELQDRFDSLAWDTKKLQEHIQIANKEHEMMEMMLDELEDEHDEAINKIKHLETMLQDLKEENFRLKEVHGKSHWEIGNQVDEYYGQNNKDAKIFNTKDEVLPLKPNHYDLNDTSMHKYAFEVENNHKLNSNADVSLMNQIIPGVVRRREVALSQSLFSAMLSLLVGMIIWEAEDPCTPLVTALFMVVGMSLWSVVQFFSTINNKPASDAVALLSLNWFILGTVTYPMLPRVARFFAPFFMKILERVLGGFL